MKKNKRNIFKLLRAVKGVSVQEMADELEVSPSYINLIENGTRWPSDRLLRDIANYFGVSKETILNFKPKEGEENKADELIEDLLLKILEMISEI